ncbi:hypothetical protein A0J61_05467 [Choanephora cucurbitarum]|uniref:Uncharacterized protein n=1 Tax=Choanephora cucurbitarum TaxID=101091 RepID=A0A1C7NBK0_9FUNG|nr:hypothetical protein A0J61_05467 [Choanephora cucurbitarum]
MNQSTEQNNIYFLHHLATLSFHKLHTQPTLRRHLFVRNLYLVTSNLILMQEEQMWLDSCFNELNEDEDMQSTTDKENEQQNHLVMAFPFEYAAKPSSAVDKGTVFFVQP